MIEIEGYIDRAIEKEEALELFQIKGTKLLDLLRAANLCREKYCGKEIHYCTITNAKSGKCLEDCKFCAQSSFYFTDVNIYGLKDRDVLKREYELAKQYGAENFGIVTSGSSLVNCKSDYNELLNFLAESDKELDACVSIGNISYNEAKELKEKGLTRYHNNLQTAPDKYDRLVATTHSVKERIESIKAAKKAGLKVCSGGIIGMGETYKDRVDMLFELQKLGVDTVPLNILIPIKGTPYGNLDVLEVDEVLKTIAIYRLVLKDKIIKVAAGRETVLKDFMGTAFLSGANGMLVGGYLTVKGRSVEEDMNLIDNIKLLWE